VSKNHIFIIRYNGFSIYSHRLLKLPGINFHKAKDRKTYPRHKIFSLFTVILLAGASGRVLPQSAEIGKTAPDFTLTDVNPSVIIEGKL